MDYFANCQPEQRAVYVDVDGTLLFWPIKAGRVPRAGEPGFGVAPRVNEPLVRQLKKMQGDGWAVVIWSRGGTRHAELAARLCGITPDACLPKPHIAVDDHPKNVTAPEGFAIKGPDECLR